MKKAPRLKDCFAQVTVILGLLFALGCNVDTTATTATTCSAATAEIQIQNGGMVRVCGCAEAGNQFIPDGTILKCTVSAGTSIYFSFVGITTMRQITVQGVQSCPVAYPTGTTTTCVVRMNYSNTFAFTDIDDSSLTGSIIVK